MRKFLKIFTGFIATVIMTVPVLGQPTDLFISEYVEGSGFNKAIEIYNGTGSSINLATGQYVLEVYFNGSSSSTSLALTGSISSGSVFVLAHTSAALSMTPDISSGVINFNGDDAVVLRKGGISGPILDVIGQVGFDPGTQWGSNDTCTLDRTIRRKPNICQGDINPSDIFYVSQEWDGYPLNTFSGLGSHSISCSSSTPTSGGLSLSPNSLSFITMTNAATPSQTYAISGNSLTAPVTITLPSFFEISQNATGPFSSSLSIPQSSFSSNSVTLYVRYNPTSSGTYSGVANHSSGSYITSLSLSGTSVSLTPICQIQGSASASSYTNQIVATQGIVTGNYQGANGLGGFFIQDPVSDNNPATSEGIFILNTSYSVNPGDYVTLSGTVEEYFNRTQIKSLTSLSIQSTTAAITPVIFSLPASTPSDFEQLEGMRVKFTQTLSVSEVYSLARFGEVLLSSNGRLIQPTNFIDPNDAVASGTNSSGTSNVAAVTIQQNLNDLNQITLDDKSNVQNPPVVPYVDPVNNTLRCGSTISNLDGIMDYAFNLYRIQPVVAPAFTYSPRPAVPGVGLYNVKVASFNVLNYFNGNGLGGGFPTSRGASTAMEFTRQRNKIISAISQINADVVGIMEMENDGDGSQSAIADLVNGLNTVMGSGTYTFVPDPTALNGGTGTDEIKVALIYKPSVLTCTGSPRSDNNIVHNRPPLAQTFILNSNQEKFSVIVNHFKSKGCTGATGSNTDQLDGQGCYNNSRKLQAAALLSFINTIKIQAVDNDVLAIGDFNAYEQEDPIDMLIAGGLTHLLNNTYSFVYLGQAGSLDHAFVTPSLAGQVSGANKWHINSDEPVSKDYNQEFNPSYMYSADAFRSSDHDPVLIGLGLVPSITISIANVSSVTCNGSANGSATLNVSGGDGPLSYTWSPSGGSNTIAASLGAGMYTFSATDGTNVSTKTINITQPTAISGSIATQSVTCYGGNNGIAFLNASGGTGSLTYLWNGVSATTATASSLQAGVYTVTATDANLCTFIQTLSITQPAATTIAIIGSSSVTCNGLSNGSATVSASGGSGNHTYMWSGGSNTPSASSLQAGIYTVTVQDANLCSTTQTISIVQPPATSITLINSSNVTCNGYSDGSASFSVSGGNGNYTYTWNPVGGTNAQATSLTPGTYTLNVSDANFCTSSQTITITQPSAITMSLNGSTQASCYGLSDGSASFIVNGGNGNYTYSWSPSGGTTAIASNLGAGIYTLTAKDANLCSITKTVNITQPAMINISTNTNGYVISANTNGASYQWINCSDNTIIPGATSQNFTPVVPGNYAVIITENSCSDTSACTTILLTGINKFATNETRLLVYPNPVKDNSVFIETEETVKLEFINQLGQIVIESSFESGKHRLYLGEINAGVYYVRATSLSRQRTIKLIKTE